MTTSETRSKIMRSVPRKDTKPEIFVRSLLHRMGLRFRLHPKNLPGTPDIVLSRHRTVVFVHGCFWHRHPRCRYASTPKTRLDFWLPKFESNIQRDSKKEVQLRDLGWRVLVVWECETRCPDQLKARLAYDFLDFGSVGKS
ncbi:very short patch repair endonuclease [Pseudomonas syringae]|uniref:very short patch repair endonuclease n=1 Tax=Pseudomonas syringae TaxID=317 RepID=UPI00190F7131|nr:very short patch repair endonuclease [Pseudomonas syringae]MDY2564053.1 very short patch repair endonuclease [Pseudomonas syringae]